MIPRTRPPLHLHQGKGEVGISKQGVGRNLDLDPRRLTEASHWAPARGKKKRRRGRRQEELGLPSRGMQASASPRKSRISRNIFREGPDLWTVGLGVGVDELLPGPRGLWSLAVLPDSKREANCPHTPSSCPEAAGVHSVPTTPGADIQTASSHRRLLIHLFFFFVRYLEKS